MIQCTMLTPDKITTPFFVLAHTKNYFYLKTCATAVESGAYLEFSWEGCSWQTLSYVEIVYMENNLHEKGSKVGEKFKFKGLLSS